MHLELNQRKRLHCAHDFFSCQAKRDLKRHHDGYPLAEFCSEAAVPVGARTMQPENELLDELARYFHLGQEMPLRAKAWCFVINATPLLNVYLAV
jgi:hypothetical protein